MTFWASHDSRYISCATVSQAAPLVMVARVYKSKARLMAARLVLIADRSGRRLRNHSVLTSEPKIFVPKMLRHVKV